MKETVTKTYLPQTAYQQQKTYNTLLTLINLTRKHTYNHHTSHNVVVGFTGNVSVRILRNKMSRKRLISIYEDAKGKL